MVAQAMIHNFSIHTGRHWINFSLVDPILLLELSKAFNWL